VLVGLATGDEAAVVRIAGDPRWWPRADFFPPVVDAYDRDPIAAANALSNVFPMGGTP
jgi:selenide,water dikinase